jgi:hypothetical protein
MLDAVLKVLVMLNCMCCASAPRLGLTHDFNGPDMKQTRAEDRQKQEGGRLETWRDRLIKRLREADLGEFDHHMFRVSDRQHRLADMLTGKLSEQDFMANETAADFVDIYGLRNAGQPNASVDWLATSDDAVVRERSSYGTFAFAIPLTAAYWKTGDVAYMRKWFAIAADFARHQRQAVEAIPAAKRRMENAPWAVQTLACLHQGDRVRNLIRCLAVFAKSLPAATDGSKPDWEHILGPVASPASPDSVSLIPARDLAAIVDSLTHDHPRQLLDFYLRPGAVPNQRSGGLHALLMLGFCFPEAEGMDEVSRKAGEAMQEHLTSTFHKDGGMLERSLNYNVSECARLRQIGRMLRSKPPPWLDLLADRVKNFHCLLIGISTPLQELPVVGNNSSNPPPAWTSESIRQALFEKHARESPRIITQNCDFSSIAFPFSGYYAQRRDWKWDSPYLFMTNSRPSGGHQSMDNLAIELHAYGRAFLVRGGPPPYSLMYLPADRRADVAKIEAYFSEHSSHKLNTVLVDGRSQARCSTSATTSFDEPVEGRWHATDAFDLVDGRYDLGYGSHEDPSSADFSVTHQRRIIHVRSLACWILTDTMTCRDDRKHEFTQIWKFSPPEGPVASKHGTLCGFKAEHVQAGDRVIRTLDPSGPNLALYQFGNVPLTYSKYFGETNPYRGWYARTIGELTPSVDIHTTWRAQAVSSVATLLWPTPSGTPPIRSIDRSGDTRSQAVTGFTAVLKDGSTLGFAESAGEGRQLDVAGIQATAEMLIVTRQGRNVRGLVLGCKDWTDGRYQIRPKQTDFEFACRVDGGFDIVATINTPLGFRWSETSRGTRPDYSQSADQLPADGRELAIPDR